MMMMLLSRIDCLSSLVGFYLQEEEYRHSHEPRYRHLNDDLHVEITAYAAPAEAHARIALALTEIRRFLVPVRLQQQQQQQHFLIIRFFPKCD
jgi:hypothetical protein